MSESKSTSKDVSMTKTIYITGLKVMKSKQIDEMQYSQNKPVHLTGASQLPRSSSEEEQVEMELEN